MATKKEHLGTEMTIDQKLCRKWGTDYILSANSLESTHQHILDIVRRFGALDSMKKSSKIYFAQKIEFEDLYQKGVNRCFDYYQTKDERMKFWRNLKGKEYNDYMELIKGEKQYH